MTIPDAYGNNWRGFDGELEMTANDWHRRGHEQASCFLATGSIELANPDVDGIPTGGCYNGDYTDEEHAAANAELDSYEGGGILGGAIRFLFGIPKS